MTYRAAALGTAVALATLSPVGAARTSLAYWSPDRQTRYEWTEGAPAIANFFGEGYVPAGFIVADIVNDGTTPLMPTQCSLDGRAADELIQERSLVWWRLVPRPLAAGAMGELLVRPRKPIEKAVEVRLTFDDGSSWSATVGPDDVPPFRLETIGFNQAMDALFAVVERPFGGNGVPAKVLLDGRDLTAAARLLDPQMSTGLAPIDLSLEPALTYGSYHVLQVLDAQGKGCGSLVRAYDGWVPLGTYGYTTFEEFARNGCNGHSNFGRHSKGDLDTQLRLGMRGVMICGDSPPAPEIAGHPGVFAYGPLDEPDCHDYNENDIPANERIGFYAPEMERRLQLYRTADARNLTTLTLDLTYKPANYYVYGLLPDVPNFDCYPISIGRSPRLVRAVVETARCGAAPRPVLFTYESWFPDPQDPDRLAKMKFPRPPTAVEERLMMYYAIAAGARGLWGYIHCTEKIGNSLFRGSRDYPDLWSTIGRTYRELEHVAPLLALAHPSSLATSDRQEVSVATLVAGPGALLLTCLNEDWEQTRDGCPIRPQNGVTLTVPKLPWLQPTVAWHVTEEGFEPLPMTDGKVTLDRLEVAELVLVAADPGIINALQARYDSRQAQVAGALLAMWRERQEADGREAETRRRLAGEGSQYVVVGQAVNAYGVDHQGLWNPTGLPHAGWEFGQNEPVDDPDRGAEWTFTVPAEQAGKAHHIYALAGAWGRPARWELTGPDGQLLLRREMSGSRQLVSLEVPLPAAGEYSLRFLQGGRGPKGGQVTQAIYVVPGD